MTFERTVNLREQVGQQIVVISEFEQLGIRVLQNLYYGGRGLRFIVNKRCRPADNYQVIGIIRKSGTHDLIALGSRERNNFSPDQLGNLIGIGIKQFSSGSRMAV